MINLSDTQRILLCSAAQRDSGSFLPLPTNLKAGGGTSKALAALLKRRLADERATSDPASVRRSDGDISYGLFITVAGAAAIGVDLGSDTSSETPAPDVPPPAQAETASKAPTKNARVIAPLSRTGGATLPELIEATGWLPQTTRAALTVIRKKGTDVVRGKRGGTTCYRILAAA